MLELLHIRNLALIEDMSLEFGKGINALTGETGAGKSFILKALGFLLGDKLSADIVRPGADRALVEAIFIVDQKELILRRELIAATGRSRFYVNDSLSSQEASRELRQKLISHTSQHAQQQLLQPAWQAELFDKCIPKRELLRKRDELLAKLKDLAAQIREIEARQAKLAEKRELLEMQKAEIEKVAPKPGEEERLEEIRASARSDVAARQNYKHAQSILHGDDGPGLLQLMQDLERLVRQLGNEEDAALIDRHRQDLSRIGANLPKPRGARDKTDMNAIEERLFAFAQLKRKLKRSLPEILNLETEINENLSFLDVCALDIGRLRREEKALAGELSQVTDELAPLREQAGAGLAARLEAELRKLGFSEHVKVLPQFTPIEIWPGVTDTRGQIEWAPNPGQKTQPLDKIASGGELSRFLLALNTLDEQADELTYIFDEVDAGVGGLTLNKLADKLKLLSAGHQIILITHWPQLAAISDRHFHIAKVVRDGNTFTLCSPLAGAAQKEELARMAGGGAKGDALAENLLNS